MAFTEFYCNSLGSNLNGGSDNNANAKFISVHGNWSTTTANFRPTDGQNPVSNGVNIGDFASIFNDGATLGVYIGRINAVQNAVNGNITVSSGNSAGTAPTTNGVARSIRVGGAWLGPNG